MTDPRIAVIQRNAITSWTFLRPRPEILLFGDVSGAQEICRQLETQHISGVACSEFGTPLLNDIFEKAQRMAAFDLMCYVNADMVLMGDFASSVSRVRGLFTNAFLMSGGRWGCEISESLNFYEPDWEKRLLSQVKESGLFNIIGNDYFVFPRGFYVEMPPFAVGHGWFDGWLFSYARRLGAPIIDASRAVVAVHQNHDFKVDGKAVSYWETEEAKRNLRLTGESQFGFTLDATHQLTSGGIKRAWKPLRIFFFRVHSLVSRGVIWTTPLRYRLGLRRSNFRGTQRRFSSFMKRSWRKKVARIDLALKVRIKRCWNRWLPAIPLLTRLPYGGWWLAQVDPCGDGAFFGTYEQSERYFVERFLRDGMTVLDIGAHHGFYTILASKKVGPRGRVIAFEPSFRERKRLFRHLKLNCCSNVRVESFALASWEGRSTLFVTGANDTLCNSLRPPAVTEPTQMDIVDTTTLDSYLQKSDVSQVDFIKMDTEGAELEVLKGSQELLSRQPRPVFMVEMEDKRTNPWGYPASAIYDSLSSQRYWWFSISGGKLLACPRMEHFSANLVAVPEERTDQLKDFLAVS